VASVLRDYQLAPADFALTQIGLRVYSAEADGCFSAFGGSLAAQESAAGAVRLCSTSASLAASEGSNVSATLGAVAVSAEPFSEVRVVNMASSGDAARASAAPSAPVDTPGASGHGAAPRLPEAVISWDVSGASGDADAVHERYAVWLTRADGAALAGGAPEDTALLHDGEDGAVLLGVTCNRFWHEVGRDLPSGWEGAAVFVQPRQAHGSWDGGRTWGCALERREVSPEQCAAVSMWSVCF
jgi:hypothetical protein